MGHRGLVSLDKNYFKTSMLEMAAEYVKAAADLTINDADRLKQSNQRMKANIQEHEREKDASIAGLQKKVADLGKHNREVTGALERAKSEKGIFGERAESMTEMMRRMKKDHDTSIEKIRVERKEDMDRMQKLVDRLMGVMRLDSETIDKLEAEVKKTSGGE